MSGLERESGIQPEPTDGLTPEQDALAVELLSLWNGGMISTGLYKILAGMTTQAIVEVVLFRVNEDGALETLLIPRPDDDSVWPGKLHTPGTAVRKSDYDQGDENVIPCALERLVLRELYTPFAAVPTYVGHLYRMTDRGPESVDTYIAKLPEEAELPPGSIWYPVSQLETNPLFIPEQLVHVRMAEEYYRREKRWE